MRQLRQFASIKIAKTSRKKPMAVRLRHISKSARKETYLAGRRGGGSSARQGSQVAKLKFFGKNSKNLTIAHFFCNELEAAWAQALNLDAMRLMHRKCG